MASSIQIANTGYHHSLSPIPEEPDAAEEKTTALIDRGGSSSDSEATGGQYYHVST